MSVFAFHAVEVLFRDPHRKWLSGSQLAQYQASLLEDPRLNIETIKALDPASLLPTSVELPEHGLNQSRLSIQCDQPSRIYPWNPDLTLFSYVSSMVIDWVLRVGANVVTLEQTVQKCCLKEF